MSRENVEILRRFYEAWNAGDMSRSLSMLSPDAEMHELPSVPGATVHRGHGEMRKWAEALVELVPGRIQPERFIEAGESVLVPVRVSGKGRTSGVPFEISVFTLFEFADGKIWRIRSYPSEDEALKAAGLRE